MTDADDAPVTGSDDARDRRRYGWPAKLTAVGFIAVIAFGNFWLAHALFGTVVPDWVSMGFVGGMAVAVAGGTGIVGLAAWRWVAHAVAKEP